MVWTGTVHRPTNTTFAHLRTSGCRGWCNAPKFARQGAGSPAFRTMGRMQGVVHCTQFADCAGDALSHIRVRTTFKLATELRDRSSSRGRPPTRVYTVQDYNNPCDCHVGSLELATMRLPRAAAAISVLCFLSSTPGTVAALCRYCCLPATYSPLCSLAPPRSTCAALHRFSHTAC